MVMGGIPQVTVKDPPMEGEMDAPSRPSTSHVAHRGYYPGIGMENTGTDPKGEHRHKIHRPVRDPVEGGGGSDWNSPLASLHMHGVLHGFRNGRGTGMAIMELKLDQELSRID